jgi:hypothetical protein
MGPLGLTIGKTLGAGLGSRLGSSKMISGEGPSMAPGAGTGLLGSTYEQLGEAKGGIDEAMRGQAMGAAGSQLMSGLTGMAGSELKSGFGKMMAGKGINIGASPELGGGLSADAQSLYESMGPSSALDILSQSLQRQQGGYMQGYQGGGEARGALMRAFEAADLNRDKIMGEASERQRVEKLGLEEMLGLAGGMKHAKSAKESEDIYQKSLGDMDKGNLISLLGLIDDAKWEASHSGTTGDYWGVGETNWVDDLKPLEPLKNPFKDMDLPPDVLVDTPWEGIGVRSKDGDYEESMKRAISMFPEAYQDKPKSWLQRLLGRQMGGSISPYNLGGSVTQQPMAYQLGGLLKYRRSPMMG